MKIVKAVVVALAVILIAVSIGGCASTGTGLPAEVVIDGWP